MTNANVTVLAKSASPAPRQAARSWSQKATWKLAWVNVSPAEAAHLVANCASFNTEYKTVPVAQAAKYL